MFKNFSIVFGTGQTHNPAKPNFTIENGNSTKYSSLNLQLELIENFTKSDLLKNNIIKIYEELVRKKKFNGKKLIELGIVDKEIPIYVKEFKTKIKTDYGLDFNDWLDNNRIETIDLVLNNYILSVSNK